MHVLYTILSFIDMKHNTSSMSFTLTLLLHLIIILIAWFCSVYKCFKSVLFIPISIVEQYSNSGATIDLYITHLMFDVKSFPILRKNPNLAPVFLLKYSTCTEKFKFLSITILV